MLFKHIFCKVRLPGGRLQYYRTKDKTICVGEYVIVPLDEIGRWTIGRVENTQLCSFLTAPQLISDTKIIIKKADSRRRSEVDKHNKRVQKQYYKQQKRVRQQQEQQMLDELIIMDAMFDMWD